MRFFVFMAVALLARAQDTAGIQGVVTHATTGQPLSRVHVALMVREENVGLVPAYGALTDEQGRFSIVAIQPGVYFVRPERAGFYLSPAKDGPAVPILELKSGQRMANYRIDMSPRAVLSGRVIAASGDPVGDVTVRAAPEPAESNSLEFLMAGFGTTNDRGEYRMSVPRGKYRMRAEVVAHNSEEPEEIRTDGSTPTTYPTTWYPKATNAAGASVVEAREGMETPGLDIRLGNSVRLHIDGTVTGIPSGAKVFVNVNAMIHQGNQVNDVAVAPDGSFTLDGLQQGNYVVYAWTNEQNHLQSAPAEIELSDNGVSNVVLALKPPGSLSGVLAMEPGAGEAANHTVRIEPLTGGAGRTGDYRSGTVNAQGEFAIRGITPDRYGIRVRPLPEDAYVKSVTMDGAAAPFGIVDLRNGGNGSKLKITVGGRGARIAGTVTGKSGQPLRGGSGGVLLIPEGAEHATETWRDVTAGADGAYSFSGLPPGKYKMVAWEHPGESRPVAEQPAEAVELKEGDRVTKDLKVK